MRKVSFIQPDPQHWMAKFKFSVPIKVRYCETDLLGHVNNVSYFIYFEQGRVDYFSHLALSELLFNEESVTVVADLECQYLAQIYIEDSLRLYTRIAKIGRSSIDLEYALVEESTSRLKAAGRGAMVHINKQTGKSSPLPDSVRDIIISYEGSDVSE